MYFPGFCHQVSTIVTIFIRLTSFTSFVIFARFIWKKYQLNSNQNGKGWLTLVGTHDMNGQPMPVRAWTVKGYFCSITIGDGDDNIHISVNRQIQAKAAG